MEMLNVKHIITRTRSDAWFGSDYTMNIYRGCSHGCIYCDSRSSCYGITDFGTVCAKANSTSLIQSELRSKQKKGVVATGAMSDPYNPQEQKFKLTQAALELLNRYHFGVAIATKSDLITRDIPVLQSIAHHSPVLCKITLTTVSDTLAAKVEPRAPSPTQRLKAIESLAKAGVFCGVLLMPVLPFIEDDAQAIAQLIESCASAGAHFIYPAFGVTLRENQREWYFNALRQAFPHAHLPERYAKAFGNAYECHCPEVKGLWFSFKSLCVQQNLLFNMSDIIRTYKSPYLSEQLNFFDL